MEHNHLLSTHFQSKSVAISYSAIQTFAIKLIYYQLSCEHIHLLSSLICYPALFAIRPHLLSCLICYPASSAIRAHLLSSLICYQFSVAGQRWVCNIYICNLCLSVCLFVCPIITQESQNRFAPNFDLGRR